MQGEFPDKTTDLSTKLLTIYLQLWIRAEQKHESLVKNVVLGTNNYQQFVDNVLIRVLMLVDYLWKE
jgi:hypothetical protein